MAPLAPTTPAKVKLGDPAATVPLKVTVVAVSETMVAVPMMPVPVTCCPTTKPLVSGKVTVALPSAVLAMVR